MVNVAEEVKNPERTLPRAILLTIVISTALYLAVALAAVLVLALALPLVTLAKVTSFAVLAVFAIISLALIRLKRAGPPAGNTYTVPAWVPYASMASALALLALQVASMLS